MSNDVSVRHVRASESERLRALRLKSLASDPDAFGSTHAHELGYPSERWEQWAADSEHGTSQRTFVAVTEPDDWRGIAVVRLQDDAPGVAALYGMWVAPEARGRGVARRLCDACAAWSAEHGCRELRLWVEAGNHSAQRAYEAAGFEATGQDSWTRPDAVTQLHIVMTRRLEPR